MVYQVEVAELNGNKLIVDVCQTEEQFRSVTVWDLKTKISPLVGKPADDLRLVFGGKQLEDDRLLSHYGIQRMSTIHVLERMRGGGDPQEGNMGDRDDRNLSMDRLSDFNQTSCVLL